jgi:hypothetical protein
VGTKSYPGLAALKDTGVGRRRGKPNCWDALKRLLSGILGGDFPSVGRKAYSRAASWSPVSVGHPCRKSRQRLYNPNDWRGEKTQRMSEISDIRSTRSIVLRVFRKTVFDASSRVHFSRDDAEGADPIRGCATPNDPPLSLPSASLESAAEWPLLSPRQHQDLKGKPHHSSHGLHKTSKNF